MGGREQAYDGILTSVAHHCVWDGQGQGSTFDSYPVFSTLFKRGLGTSAIRGLQPAGFYSNY